MVYGYGYYGGYPSWSGSRWGGYGWGSGAWGSGYGGWGGYGNWDNWGGAYGSPYTGSYYSAPYYGGYGYGNLGWGYGSRLAESNLRGSLRRLTYDNEVDWILRRY